MNTRRGFLDTMLKASVACAVAPVAVVKAYKPASEFVIRKVCDHDGHLFRWWLENGEEYSEYCWMKDGKWKKLRKKIEDGGIRVFAAGKVVAELY